MVVEARAAILATARLLHFKTVFLSSLNVAARWPTVPYVASKLWPRRYCFMVISPGRIRASWTLVVRCSSQSFLITRGSEPYMALKCLCFANVVISICSPGKEEGKMSAFSQGFLDKTLLTVVLPTTCVPDGFKASREDACFVILCHCSKLWCLFVL